MKIVSATVAAALAFAGVPSALTAQPGSPAALGIAFMPEGTKVKVAEILPGGAGDLMGVRPGDVITYVGSTRVSSMGKLSAFIRNLKVGDPVEVTVKRKGESLTLKGTAMARRK
jgi:S1-C subfamily serine protease